MPRPRTYDREAVLDAAIRTFWTLGYEATSTEALCEATGLGRGSLYHAFTSKHDLYVTALEHYMDEKTADVIGILDGPGTVRDRIETLLGVSVDPDPDDPRGCLVVNAVVELGPSDARVAEVVGRDQRRRLDAVRLTLAAGQREGTISARRPAEDLARFVLSTISGLRAETRGGADRAARLAIATAALDAL